tara:strand:+ start:53 stop:307 length:255 start_codon:yes stop_codon:yes gene_type:complete
MIIKNSPSPKNSNQAQEIGHIKYSYKESFKRENKSILDDSEFIENYNNALKSPQSRRLYKTLENENYHDTIIVQNISPLDKISI